MLECNRYLDHLTLVIAIYNGTATGGTAQAVKYAYSQHRTVIIINPDTFEIIPYTIVISIDSKYTNWRKVLKNRAPNFMLKYKIYN